MGDVDFLFDGIDAIERLARLRELCALVALYAGWEHPAVVDKKSAETAGGERRDIGRVGDGRTARFTPRAR